MRFCSFLVSFASAKVGAEALAAVFEAGVGAVRLLFFLGFLLVGRLDRGGSGMALLIDFASPAVRISVLAVLCTPFDGRALPRHCGTAPALSSSMSLV